MKHKIRIATRESPLALWQAHFVEQQLTAVHPELEIEIIGMTTKGDQVLDVTLSKVGGKGLFVKELEHALLDETADIAVHSMKDVPSEFPDGLCLPVICERAKPLDCFVSNQYESFDDLPEGAVVGTSSLRRQAQLKAKRPDLIIKPLRGNVNTRLKKLDAGDYDGICLAAIGLQRLQLDDRIQHCFDINDSLPAVGQGALGIECRAKDHTTQALITVLHHFETWHCVMAERAMNAVLGGSCHFPIAGHATLEKDQLHLQGLVGSIDGDTIIRFDASGDKEDHHAIGEACAQGLLQSGAKALLEAI